MTEQHGEGDASDRRNEATGAGASGRDGETGRRFGSVGGEGHACAYP
jgi:hypothetical protein